MKHDSLKNCIVALERLLDAKHSQLDTGVRTELGAVIAELKRLSESQGSSVELGAILSLRVLEAINHAIALVTNITDLME